MGNNVLYLLKKALYNGMLIPVIYGCWMAVVACQQLLFSDWDGVMHYFSGMDLMHGNGYRGWGSHFWPPLYPLLTGILSAWMDGVIAARIISVVSASLLLFVAHRFVYRLSGNNIIACLAQLLISTNYTFVLLSIKAENHMLDSLFYLLAILLLWKSLEKDGRPRYLLIGVVCGLAGLSRYTSYSLLPACVCTLFCFYRPGKAISHSARLLLGFVLVSSPWWVINYLDNGSPVATWQYMNIGAGVFTTHENKWWWWWSGIDAFQSITDVVRHDPAAYIHNFFRNVVKSGFLILFFGQLTGIFCILAVILFVFRQYFREKIAVLRTRPFLPVLLCGICFVGLVSQAFVFGDVFLSWLVLVIIYGIYAIYRLSTVRLFEPVYRPVILAVIVLVICFDLFYSIRQFNMYIAFTSGLEETQQVTTALRQADPAIEQKVVMSFHPGRAYHLGSRYIMLPPYYKGELNGLVAYQQMSYKVRDHAPRFPSTIDINDLKVDYLVYDKKALVVLPQYSFLLKKDDSRIPANFRLLYLSHDVAVYKIN